jgi:hypothetical protein
MPNHDFDLSSIIPSIHVHPFPPIQLVKGDSFIDRIAIIECPFCLAFGNAYEIDEKKSRFILVSCAGNLPPEYECVNSSHLGFKPHTHTNICSSIKEPHFHVQCDICDERFYLSKPHKEEIKWEE